jgi:hypothetical protein
MTTRARISPDSWALDAAHRLRKHLMRAVTVGKNFAPDQTYELSKAGKVGPLSAQIAEIFQRHAGLWAADQRDLAAAKIDTDQDAYFALAMQNAELEVGRFLAGHKLRGAA